MRKTIFSFLAFSLLFGQVDYESQIQSIFIGNCTSCHQNGGGYQNNLDLTSYDNLMDGESDNGPVVIPGDHAGSLLWQKVNSGAMPPGANPDLSSDEINLIAQWIDEGATETPAVDVTDLFFSEYAEGTSNNKYLEIYNSSGASVDLSTYSISTCNNGCDAANEFDYPDNVTFAAGTVLDDGDVYVVCHGSASDEISAECDQTFTYLSNGDDFQALTLAGATASSYTVIDQIGDWGDDPGEGWDVAGVSEATKDHTLVRKANVTEGNGGDWASSAGTNEDDSEWHVLDQDTWEYLGSHPHDISGPAPTVVVNEFLADAGSCCGAEIFGDGEDFVELYNHGDESVNIMGWGFGDTDGEVETTAPDTSIAPDGFIVLWYTGNNDAVFPEVDAKLSAGGEAIYIADADGNTVVYMEFGEQSEDISYGRVPDGADAWEYLDPPSPGATNAATGDYTAIYDIQFVADPDADDASPLNGQEVTIHGVVTAEFWGSDQYRYMHVQDAEGPWNGIVCFEYGGWDSFGFVDENGNSVIGPGEGDEVTLTGTVEEYYNLTEILDVTEVVVHGPVDEMISPSVVAVGDIGEAYEGCLIAVTDVTVDDPDLGYGEWSMTDGTSSIGADDKWDYFFYPDEGQNLAEVTGILDYGYGNYKLQPRLARDVVEADGDPIRIQRIQQVLYSDLLKAGADEVSDISYMNGDTVLLEGIVTMPTGLSYAGAGVKFIFADANGGPWSGVLSYDPDSSAFPILFEGDLIQATGFISEYTTGPANMTELFITEPVNILDFEQPLPVVDTVNTGDLRWPTEAEQWGNVMVRIEDGMVTDNDLLYEVFEVDDGTGGVPVDDDSDSIQVYFAEHGPPPVGSLVQSIEGWLYHHYGSYDDSTAYKLCPLYMDDIEFGAGPPSIIDLSRDPCAPTSEDTEVTVSCVITDNSTVAEAWIYYSIDDGEYQTASMSTSDDSTYSGVIPISAGNVVNYYISATDDGVDQVEPKTSLYPFDIENEQLGFLVTDNLTIENVQYTPWPSGNTLYEGCDVSLTGIVTADSAQYNTSYSSYAFQDGTGQWNGLVFDTESLVDVTRGDDVTVTGHVTDFDETFLFQNGGNTRLIDAAITINSTQNDEPAPTLATCRALAQSGEEVESYEGVLVKITDVTVSSINQYDWSVTDATGSEALIDDDMAVMAADNFMSDLEVGQELEYVMGIFNYSFGTYKIQIRDLDDFGSSAGINDDVHVNPYEYALHENYPNPFNPETQIRFSIGGQENVKLVIYDVMGRQVRTLVNGDSFNSGFHVINWNGLDNVGNPVASGMYFYRIKAGDFIAHKKMMLVK